MMAMVLMLKNSMVLSKDNSGFGLTMMKERIYLLAGDISIESKKKEGTKISVKVPIINKEE